MRLLMLMLMLLYMWYTRMWIEDGCCRDPPFLIHEPEAGGSGSGKRAISLATTHQPTNTLSSSSSFITITLPLTIARADPADRRPVAEKQESSKNGAYYHQTKDQRTSRAGPLTCAPDGSAAAPEPSQGQKGIHTDSSPLPPTPYPLFRLILRPAMHIAPLSSLPPPPPSLTSRPRRSAA